MTQALLHFLWFLSGLCPFALLFAVLSLKLLGTLFRVWTSVYLNYALCTLSLCLDMSMLVYILSYPCYYLVHAMLGSY
jgi:hypothetical protein